MSDLDKKLDQAITSSFSIWKAAPHESTEDSPNRVQWFRPNGGELWFFGFNKGAVKQAFIDAGWSDGGDLAPYYIEMVKAYIKAGGAADCVLMSRNDWEVNSKLSGLMTGQEWHEKFEAELKGKVFPHYCSEDQANVLNVLSVCQGAAKKAAGIE
jgi:hypothetical protein